jgi:GNAT superfamily N-acetyltransferase
MTREPAPPPSAPRRGTKIRLRRVRSDDGPDLARAWTDQAETYARLDPEVFRVPSSDGLGAWLVASLAEQADPERRLVLVADVDGAAVGFVVAAVVAPHLAPERQMQRGLDTRSVRIEALVVRRDHWRRGVGTRLVTAVEDWARNRRAALVTAQALTGGPAADFLAARGYAPRAVLHGRTL